MLELELIPSWGEGRYTTQASTKNLRHECFTRGIELTALSHAKSPRKRELLVWLGMRDGNITFEDSLDFDISEIEGLYDDV